MTRADKIRKTFDDCKTDEQIAMDIYETIDDCEVCPINSFCRSEEHLFSRECCTEVILAYLQEEVSEAGETAKIISKGRFTLPPLGSILS